MKNFILLVALVSLVGAAYGQAAKAKAKPTSSAAANAASSGNCFNDWYKLFKERGGDAVPDGTHDVVITIRNGDFSDCYMGRIDVAGGVLNSPLQIQKLDGSWEEFDKRVSTTIQGADGRLDPELRKVNNGMSSSVQLQDGELIRLFFYKFLREKPKGNKRAPNPSSLVKNN